MQNARGTRAEHTQTHGNTRRLQGYEQEALWNLMAAEHSLNRTEGLKRRFGQITMGNADIGLLKAKTKALLERCMDTVPTDQLLSIRRNLGAVRIQIGIQRPTNRQDEFGRWISWDAIGGMEEAMKEHCMMCDKSFDDRCKCKLRKALNELPIDLPEDDGNSGCPYFTIWGQF